MLILSKYSIYNVQTLKNIIYWIHLFTNFFLKIYYSSSYFILINNSMSIKTWKVNIFSTGKELYESILILAKLWLILSVISFFSRMRYLLLSQVLSNQLQSNNSKYLTPLWILISSSILWNLIHNGFARWSFVWNVVS